MIPTFFIWLAAVLEFTALSWLLARLAEGLFRFELDGNKNMPRVLVPVITAVVAAIACGIYCGVNQPDTWLPISELYAKGIILPLETTAGLMVAAGTTYGAARLIGSIGGIMHAIGDGISNGFEGVRGWIRGRKASRKDKAQKMQEKQTSDFQLFEQKSTEVSNLCSSLRYSIKDEAALKHLSEIADTLNKVRQVIREDGNKQSVVPMLVSDYLTPAAQYLRVYERLLKRNLESAQPAVQDMEQKTLPLMAAKIGVLYDQIHVNDVAQLSTASSAFEVARKIELPAEAPAELRL
jgi:hypothetical protein